MIPDVPDRPAAPPPIPPPPGGFPLRPDLAPPADVLWRQAPPEPTLPEAHWSLSSLVPVLLTPYGFLTVFFVVFGGRFIPGRIGDLLNSYLGELVYGASVLFWLRFVQRASDGAIRSPLGLRSGRPGADLGLGAVLGVAMLFLGGLVGQVTLQIITAILGHAPKAPVVLPSDLTGGWYLLLGPAVFVVAPFCEEILFRGFVFGGLRRRLSFWPAALVSAALFAAIHVDPQRLPIAFSDGLVLAGLYESRRSLYATMAAHATNNLIIFLVSLPSMGLGH